MTTLSFSAAGLSDRALSVSDSTAPAHPSASPSIRLGPSPSLDVALSEGVRQLLADMAHSPSPTVRQMTPEGDRISYSCSNSVCGDDEADEGAEQALDDDDDEALLFEEDAVVNGADEFYSSSLEFPLLPADVRALGFHGALPPSLAVFSATTTGADATGAAVALHKDHPSHIPSLAALVRPSAAAGAAAKPPRDPRSEAEAVEYIAAQENRRPALLAQDALQRQKAYGGKPSVPRTALGALPGGRASNFSAAAAPSAAARASLLRASKPFPLPGMRAAPVSLMLGPPVVARPRQPVTRRLGAQPAKKGWNPRDGPSPLVVRRPAAAAAPAPNPRLPVVWPRHLEDVAAPGEEGPASSLVPRRLFSDLVARVEARKKIAAAAYAALPRPAAPTPVDRAATTAALTAPMPSREPKVRGRKYLDMAAYPSKAPAAAAQNPAQDARHSAVLAHLTRMLDGSGRRGPAALGTSLPASSSSSLRPSFAWGAWVPAGVATRPLRPRSFSANGLRDATAAAMRSARPTDAEMEWFRRSAGLALSSAVARASSRPGSRSNSASRARSAFASSQPIFARPFIPAGAARKSNDVPAAASGAFATFLSGTSLGGGGAAAGRRRSSGGAPPVPVPAAKKPAVAPTSVLMAAPAPAPVPVSKRPTGTASTEAPAPVQAPVQKRPTTAVPAPAPAPTRAPARVQKAVALVDTGAPAPKPKAAPAPPLRAPSRDTFPLAPTAAPAPTLSVAAVVPASKPTPAAGAAPRPAKETKTKTKKAAIAPGPVVPLLGPVVTEAPSMAVRKPLPAAKPVQGPGWDASIRPVPLTRKYPLAKPELPAPAAAPRKRPEVERSSLSASTSSLGPGEAKAARASLRQASAKDPGVDRGPPVQPAELMGVRAAGDRSSLFSEEDAVSPDILDRAVVRPGRGRASEDSFGSPDAPGPEAAPSMASPLTLQTPAETRQRRTVLSGVRGFLARAARTPAPQRKVSATAAGAPGGGDVAPRERAAGAPFIPGLAAEDSQTWEVTHNQNPLFGSDDELAWPAGEAADLDLGVIADSPEIVERTRSTAAVPQALASEDGRARTSASGRGSGNNPFRAPPAQGKGAATATAAAAPRQSLTAATAAVGRPSQSILSAKGLYVASSFEFKPGPGPSAAPAPAQKDRRAHTRAKSEEDSDGRENVEAAGDTSLMPLVGTCEPVTPSLAGERGAAETPGLTCPAAGTTPRFVSPSSMPLLVAAAHSMALKETNAVHGNQPRPRPGHGGRRVDTTLLSPAGPLGITPGPATAGGGVDVSAGGAATPLTPGLNTTTKIPSPAASSTRRPGPEPANAQPSRIPPPPLGQSMAGDTFWNLFERRMNAHLLQSPGPSATPAPAAAPGRGAHGHPSSAAGNETTFLTMVPESPGPGYNAQVSLLNTPSMVLDASMAAADAHGHGRSRVSRGGAAAGRVRGKTGPGSK